MLAVPMPSSHVLTTLPRSHALRLEEMDVIGLSRVPHAVADE